MTSEQDIIFKSLRFVPDFDGNPHVLTRFIKICDELVRQFMRDDPQASLSNISLINGILNKITGHAGRLINSNGIPDSWQGIRDSLINNFSDQRDETALYNDIACLTQGQNSPQEFYDKCNNLFSTIMTYVSLHETIETTIDAKRQLYRKLTLQAFIRGLKEPLGSRIRCMRPETIEKALEFVQEELNVIYLQNRNDALPKFHHTLKPQSSVQTTHTPQPLLYNVNKHNLPFPRINTPYTFPQFKSSQPNHFMPRFPTRTQQVFRAPPPNYNPNSNLFRLPPRNQVAQKQGPTPMSGVSHYVTKELPLTGHDWRKHGNPPPTNYFKSRDLNVNECVEPDYYDYYDQYNPTVEYPDYYYFDPDYNSYYNCEEIEQSNEIPDSDECAQVTETENFPKGKNSEKPK
ncbi:unnamed protein product [Leptosia nina]|uniref:Retrovirus-related Gag polyprotein from transposon HMS-Beagle n=1 Tax=Leptosia nina TaxID=320188 RepID=A0AAV1J0I4_9NEOP